MQIRKYIKRHPHHGIREIWEWIASHSESPWSNLGDGNLELILGEIWYANKSVEIRANS